eukprot:TRINITY_DN1703_c0_g1_i14.p1 TRINITY_DN1703_c0_g1~~TRINITY_DN1703_c0_g1_i14.p1  ORF type:complete len:726 (-),score=163.06 TRINITY_DN1703_c0_g1_i14:217-2394(-)
MHRYQWFYFSTTNAQRGFTVKFNIVSMTKYPHFVKDGMKPSSFSEKEYQSIYLHWNTNRIDNVTLARSPISTIKSSGERTININEKHNGGGEAKKVKYYFTLSFTHTFKYDNDKVYFSFFKPYSYTRMLNFLAQIDLCIKDNTIIYKRQVLCNSLLDLPVDIIFITSSKECAIEKTYIVITARMHSSETAGSYKVQGIIKFLLSNDAVAESLLCNHIFLIVPMVNADGVVFGNNRCSLAGNDMNRCWGNPSKNQEPIIHKLKAELRNIYKLNKNQILIYSDLHGHSRLYNSFLYACHKGTGTLCSWTKARLLPRILAKNCHMLNYHQCSFKVEPRKANTARIIIWKEFKVVNSFTWETSQFAYHTGSEVTRFTERDYTRIAEFFMLALDEYRKLLIELQNELRSGWLRPCQLQELTGVPAADLLKKEMEGEKLMLKKRERREKQNKSGIEINKANYKTRLAINLPNIEKSKAFFVPSGTSKFSRAHSIQKNTKRISWKDYFTDAELTELQKTTKEETDSSVPPKLKINFNEKRSVKPVRKPVPLKIPAISILNNDTSIKIYGDKLQELDGSLYETFDNWGSDHRDFAKGSTTTSHKLQNLRKNLQNHSLKSGLAKNSVSLTETKPLFNSRNSRKTLGNFVRSREYLDRVEEMKLSVLASSKSPCVGNLRACPGWFQCPFVVGESSRGARHGTVPGQKKQPEVVVHNASAMFDENMKAVNSNFQEE